MEKYKTIKAEIGILKPAKEVFAAIVNPVKMTNYFISSSTGPMVTGAELMWKFPEFELSFPVKVNHVVKDKSVAFTWDGNDGKPLLVTIQLLRVAAGITVVRVTEEAADGTFPGEAWLTGNTYGWANFLACLKAFAEYGINLRRGAFGHKTDDL